MAAAFSKKEIRALRGKTYQDIAFAVLSPFVDGEIPDAEFRAMIDEAYATFRHPAIAPLVQTGPNAFVMELFHGTTLAFKDVAMQLLGTADGLCAGRARRTCDHRRRHFGRYRRCGDRRLCRPRAHRHLHPVSAWQGLAGAAAADDDLDGAANVHALAIKGNFDDCQNLVKAMFNDAAFRDGVALSGVNSINWARIMAQIVYYFTTALVARRAGP